jgi:hypothetical protein
VQKHVGSRRDNRGVAKAQDSYLTWPTDIQSIPVDFQGFMEESTHAH